MYVNFNRISVPQGVPFEAVRLGLVASLADFQSVPGLLKKAFLFNESESICECVYQWESRAHAESSESMLRDLIRACCGAEAVISPFETSKPNTQLSEEPLS